MLFPHVEFSLDLGTRFAIFINYNDLCPSPAPILCTAGRSILFSRSGRDCCEIKLFEKANHLKRWDAKPLILLNKIVGKQSCRAGPFVIAISGDAIGDGTFVSCVPHRAGKIRLTEVLF